MEQLVKNGRVDRTEARFIIKVKRSKQNRRLLAICLGVFVLACVVYWIPVFYPVGDWDKAQTGANILITMATNSLIMLLCRIPMIKKRGQLLEQICLCVMTGCVVINVLLTLCATNMQVEFVMTLVTGVATGAASLMFSAFNVMLEAQDKEDEKWIRKHLRRKRSKR